MWTSFIGSAAAAALALSGLTSAADAEAWKSRSIYQVMIDRYAHDDGSTTAECVPHLFCGGTWKGLKNNLDYIQDMGFTALQISPIVKNIDDHTSAGDPYHGYWPIDMYALNDRFGTEQDFKDLVDELHKRDMLLMVDVVVNHMTQAFDNELPPKIDYSKFNPFDDEKYFHDYCNVTDWEDPKEAQECWLYPYGAALADLKTESREVANEMNKWIKQLVSNYSIDGLRIDAAKHVNDEFLPAFVEASGVFAFGEVMEGQPETMCRYQSLGLLPGLPNYLEFYQLDKSFNGHSLELLADVRNQAASACNDTAALGTFIENHDLPRFASKNEDLAIAKNVMTYVILNDGIPTVYQGQEQHFNGNGTPFNREALWTSNYDRSAPLYVLTSTLNKLRNNAIKLSDEYLSTPSETIKSDVNHLCSRKGPDGSQIVFCINNKSSQGDNYEMTVRGFQPNDAVVEVLRCRTSTADAAGSVNVFMGKGEPKVYVPAAALKDTDICKETQEDGPVENGAAGLGVRGGVLAAAVLGWALMFVA